MVLIQYARTHHKKADCRILLSSDIIVCDQNWSNTSTRKSLPHPFVIDHDRSTCLYCTMYVVRVRSSLSNQPQYDKNEFSLWCTMPTSANHYSATVFAIINAHRIHSPCTFQFIKCSRLLKSGEHIATWEHFTHFSARLRIATKRSSTKRLSKMKEVSTWSNLNPNQCSSLSFNLHIHRPINVHNVFNVWKVRFPYAPTIRFTGHFYPTIATHSNERARNANAGSKSNI